MSGDHTLIPTLSRTRRRSLRLRVRERGQEDSLPSQREIRAEDSLSRQRERRPDNSLSRQRERRPDNSLSRGAGEGWGEGRRCTNRPPGNVTLVGAGPGDPELLTIKAVRAIRRATVLLVDDLVGDGVLRYARRSTRVIPVGKRGGGMCAPRPPLAAVVPQGERPSLGRPGARPSTPQAFIEKLMIAEAQRGERVVRLKGGDPFVFGRGGEEAEHLRAAGIDVHIVNGITSGLAAATALGVPWTHREHARGVMLVTGHAKEGGSAPHWPTLGAAAAQGLTLVIYMGVSQLDAIVAGLADALPAHTPAALVQAATTADEQRLVTTLGRLVADARASGIRSPAVLIVGDVLRGAAVLQTGASATAEPSRLALS